MSIINKTNGFPDVLTYCIINKDYEKVLGFLTRGVSPHSIVRGKPLIYFVIDPVMLDMFIRQGFDPDYNKNLIYAKTDTMKLLIVKYNAYPYTNYELHTKLDKLNFINELLIHDRGKLLNTFRKKRNLPICLIKIIIDFTYPRIRTRI